MFHPCTEALGSSIPCYVISVFQFNGFVGLGSVHVLYVCWVTIYQRTLFSELFKFSKCRTGKLSKVNVSFYSCIAAIREVLFCFIFILGAIILHSGSQPGGGTTPRGNLNHGIPSGWSGEPSNCLTEIVLLLLPQRALFGYLGHPEEARVEISSMGCPTCPKQLCSNHTHFRVCNCKPRCGSLCKPRCGSNHHRELFGITAPRPLQMAMLLPQVT